MRNWILVVAALSAVGCKKNKEADKAATPPAPGTSAPKAPVSTADQDALWALAPDGMAVGVVVSPAGMAKIEAGGLELKKLLDSPELAQFKAKADESLMEVLGTSNPSLASAGLSAQKGFALFAPDNGDPIVILPVADRDKFLAVVKGQKGTDSDTIKKATCKTVKNVYACAKDVALFDRLGKGSFKDQLAIVAARGELELAGTITSKTGKPPATIAIVGQLDRGIVVLRGAVKGLPDDAKKFFGNAKVRQDGDKTAGYALANLPPLVASLADQVPAEEVLPGVKANQLVKSIGGPLTVTIPNGSPIFDLRLPLNDAAPMQTLIDQSASLPPMQMFGATVKDHVLHVTIPQMLMSFDAWIENKELRIGTKGGAAPTATAPMGAIGQELAASEWMFAMYGHGTLLAAPALPMPPLDQLPPEAALGFRALSLVTEAGFGMKIDGDTLRFVASVRTIWANPDDVVKKVLAIGPKEITSGQFPGMAKAIVDASPKSAFAADYNAGYGALMMPAAAIGMLAAISVPAFMKYQMRESMKEADDMQKDMDKQIKDAEDELKKHSGDDPPPPSP
ncbi:MAG TPA: hypothetical protein VMZ53_16115 [Kofleriaceae bacterium]|nr:hypothetical protein [Kofleriaceae bacterium]